MQRCPKCKEYKLYVDDSGQYLKCTNLECGYSSFKSFSSNIKTTKKEESKEEISNTVEQKTDEKVINFICPHCSKELNIKVSHHDRDIFYECNRCNDTGYERVCDAAGSMDWEICNCKYGDDIRERHYK